MQPLTIEAIKYIVYFFFGFALVLWIISMVFSDSLWKAEVFMKCFVGTLICLLCGIFLEIVNLFYFQYLDFGTAFVVMISPLLYLLNFQLFRQIFIKWKNTEPYVTDSHSVLGGTPLDLFTSANEDGKKRKFLKDRKIMGSDFLFSFLQALIPIFITMGLLLLLKEINK